jgi:Spy/CpxP family protein refolding chaperone
MRQRRNQAIELLVAEPFDQAAYDAQLVKINQLRGQMSKRVAEDLKQLVRELPPDQRAAVGDMLKRPSPSPG